MKNCTMLGVLIVVLLVLSACGSTPEVTIQPYAGQANVDVEIVEEIFPTDVPATEPTDEPTDDSPETPPEGITSVSDRYLSARFIYEDFATRDLDAYWDFFEDGTVAITFSEAALLTMIGPGTVHRTLVGRYTVLDQLVGIYIDAETIQAFVHRVLNESITHLRMAQLAVLFPDQESDLALIPIDGEFSGDLLIPDLGDDEISALMQDPTALATAFFTSLFNAQVFLANEDFTVLSNEIDGDVLIHYGDTHVPFPRFAAQAIYHDTPPEQLVIDQDLLGVWLWEYLEYYVFNADNTGVMLMQPIRWWVTEDHVLYICNTPSFCRGYCQRPQSWDYTLDQGRLSLVGRDAFEGLAFDYYPVVPSPELHGQWAWRGTLYYTFAADGMGYSSIPHSPIRWWTNANADLFICTTPETCGTRCGAPHIWSYALDGDQMTLTSRQVTGLTFEYSRIP